MTHNHSHFATNSDCDTHTYTHTRTRWSFTVQCCCPWIHFLVVLADFSNEVIAARRGAHTDAFIMIRTFTARSFLFRVHACISTFDAGMYFCSLCCSMFGIVDSFLLVYSVCGDCCSRPRIFIHLNTYFILAFRYFRTRTLAPQFFFRSCCKCNRVRGSNHTSNARTQTQAYTHRVASTYTFTRSLIISLIFFQFFFLLCFRLRSHADSNKMEDIFSFDWCIRDMVFKFSVVFLLLSQFLSPCLNIVCAVGASVWDRRPHKIAHINAPMNLSLSPCNQKCNTFYIFLWSHLSRIRPVSLLLFSIWKRTPFTRPVSRERERHLFNCKWLRVHKMRCIYFPCFSWMHKTGRPASGKSLQYPIAQSLSLHSNSKFALNSNDQIGYHTQTPKTIFGIPMRPLRFDVIFAQSTNTTRTITILHSIVAIVC